MTQETETITRPQLRWMLYSIAFCVGLLSTPATIFALSHDAGSLATLASIAEVISTASWGVIPLVVLLLFFGDRTIVGRSVYHYVIMLSLTITACALALFAANPEAPYLSPAMVAVILLYSKPILGELINPLISTTAPSRPHRLHLFLTTTAAASVGGLTSALSISPIAYSEHTLAIPFFAMTGILMVAAAAAWNATTANTGKSAQTSDGTLFFHEAKAKREILRPLATIFLICLCVGIDIDAATPDTRNLATILLVAAATADVVILLILAQRAIRGLLDLSQLTLALSILLVTLAVLYIVTIAAGATSIWLTLQFAIGTTSGFLMVTAYVQLGNHACDAESKDGKSDVSKYFLLAFVAAIAGAEADELLQALFTSSGLPIGMMNATLTILSATLILFLTFTRDTGLVKNESSQHSSEN